MPQVNPGTILLLLVAALGGAWAAGLIRPNYEDGRLTLRGWRAGRVLATFDFRDTGLLLLLALTMGWAVAAAVERSQWVPNTDGRLVPAVAITTLLGWLLVAAGLSRLGYLLASIPVTLGSLLLLTPTPLFTEQGGASALLKWLQALPDQTNLLLLLGLLLMFALTGLWASWWIFRRRNGLVALLPTGTILAVEIINDVIPGPVFSTVVWLAAAATVLLRLNFVALKEGWRTRRVPHAADTGWTFGEVGMEATVAILAIAFLEHTAAQQRNAHRTEVIGRGGAVVCGGLRARRQIADVESARAVARKQRQPARRQQPRRGRPALHRGTGRPHRAARPDPRRERQRQGGRRPRGPLRQPAAA